jgi:hypothetical protein
MSAMHHVTFYVVVFYRIYCCISASDLDTYCLSLSFVTFFHRSLQLTFCIIVYFQVIFQISLLYSSSAFAHAPCRVTTYYADHRFLRTPFSPVQCYSRRMPSTGSRGPSAHVPGQIQGLTAVAIQVSQRAEILLSKFK